MTSTTDDSAKSRIASMLAPGEAAGLARSDVHYVVTEFGIAYLHGKSIRERALTLSLLHTPNFAMRCSMRPKRSVISKAHAQSTTRFRILWKMSARWNCATGYP